MNGFQTNALFNWGFTPDSKNEEWEAEFENVQIKWNVKHQDGAYIIDGELSLIHDWDTVEDLMEQLDIV